MSGDRCALVAVRQRGTSVCDHPASVFRAEGGPTKSRRTAYLRTDYGIYV